MEPLQLETSALELLSLSVEVGLYCASCPPEHSADLESVVLQVHSELTPSEKLTNP